MEKYQAYDLADFLKDPYFKDWATRPNQETDAFWNHFILRHPEKKETVIQAQAMLRSFEMIYSDTSPSEQLIETMFENIQNRTQPRTPSLSWWPRIAAAACVTLILGWLITYRSTSARDVAHPGNQVNSESANFSSKSNSGTNPLLFNLPDGSTVLLQPGSEIKYTTEFNQKTTREVILNGEAFFNVTRNPERPFLVHANSLTTKVLGTSFWVKSFDSDKEASVAVKTGKVAVFANDSNESELGKGIMLTPNQKISYDRKTDRVVRSVIAEPMIIPPSVSPILDFTDVPVTQVFSTIQQTYGIQIEYDARIMQNCLLTASFTNESLFEKISLICKAVEAEYVCTNGKVTISGDGCQ